MCWSAVGVTQQQQHWGATVGAGCTNQIAVGGGNAQIESGLPNNVPFQKFGSYHDIQGMRTCCSDTVVGGCGLCVKSSCHDWFSKCHHNTRMLNGTSLVLHRLIHLQVQWFAFIGAADHFSYRHQNISASSSIVVSTVLTLDTYWQCCWEYLHELVHHLQLWLSDEISEEKKNNRFDLIYTADL